MCPAFGVIMRTFECFRKKSLHGLCLLAGGMLLPFAVMAQAMPPLPLPPPPRPVQTAPALSGAQKAARPGRTIPAPVVASAPQPTVAVRDHPNGLGGRLFYTPERRIALNRLRERNTLEARLRLEPETIVTVNGLVQRSSGHRTVWVNGLGVNEGQELADLQIRQVNGATVRVLPGNAAATDLRVGQTLQRNSGIKNDLLGDGQIVVHQGSATRQPPMRPAAGGEAFPR